MRMLFDKLRRNSLRVWIVLFFVLMIIPGGALLILGSHNYAAGVRLYTQEDAKRLIENVALQESQSIGMTKQVLISLSKMPLSQKPGDPLCQNVMASAKSQYAYFSNLGIVDTHGDILCSAPPSSETINLSDRGYFQQAMQTSTFAIGDFQTSRLTNQQTIVLAYPILDASFHPKLILFAALDLSWIQKNITEVRLPTGTAVTLLDRAGTPVVFSSDSSMKVEATFPEVPSQAWFVKHETGVQQVKISNATRWLGYSPVPGTDNALTIALSLPEDYIAPELSSISSANLVWFGGIALALLTLSGLWIEHFILDRIKKLQATIHQFQEGDWDARTGFTKNYGEVNALAHEFDKMADTLQAQAKQLTQSRDFYFGLFESFPFMVWCSDDQGRSIFYNRVYTDFTGKTTDDLKIESWKDLIHPDDRERIVNLTDNALEGRSPIKLEYRLRRKDGAYHWIVDYGTPFYDQNNNFSGYIGGVLDITDRKDNESLLARYRILSDQSRDMMFFINGDGDILEANNSAVQAYGYSREELLKMNARQLRAPSKLTSFENGFDHAKHSSVVFESEHIRKDGSTFPVEVSSASSDVGGEQVLFSVVRDITERNNLQAAIFASKKMADLGTLAGGVTVKLREPLTKIIHLSEDLAEKVSAIGYDPRDGLDELLQIQRSGWECAEVLSALETYTRATPEEMQPCDVNDIVKEVLLLLEPQIRNWLKINLVTDLDVNLPMMLGDRDQIMQVLIVLLNNARDAMPEGGTLTIRTGHDDQAGNISLRVSDTGLGINADNLERIFDPFFTTKPVGKGTGLGLSIASGITRAHLGTISVTSVPRRGSTFTLIFPAEFEKAEA